MKKLIMSSFLLMMSVTVLSQNGQKKINPIATYQDRETSIKLVQGLILCDELKKDYNILVNSNVQKDIMTAEYQRQILEGIAEVQKRDDIIEKQDVAFDKAEELIVELKDLYHKEVRKKKANKYLYFGAGVLGGILITKQIQK